MYDYLLSAISCVFLFHTGLCEEECTQAVLARRENFQVSAGSSLSLSCVIQHCGDFWNGTWLWKNSTDEKFSFVKATARHHLTSVTLSPSKTRLVLKILNVNQLEEGSYGCRATWGEGNTDQGHWMYVNIITAVPSQRKILHRVLVCAGASLCLPIILGLARCLSSKVKPQPVPRTQLTCAAVYRDQHTAHSAPQPPPRHSAPQNHNSSSQKAPSKCQQKTEVVYADISQDALRQQEATRQPSQSTVYSSLKFP